MSGVSNKTVHACFKSLEEKNLIGRKLITGRRTIYLLHYNFKSFITKKLSTTHSKITMGIDDVPLVKLHHTPSKITTPPLVKLLPKQYKEQYKEQDKKQEIEFSNESPEERIAFIELIKSKMKSV